HFLECVFARRSYKTNMNCDVKTEVRHDGSEPVIEITFVDGEKLIMKAANLTICDMLAVFKSKCELKDLKSNCANNARSDFTAAGALTCLKKAGAGGGGGQTKSIVAHVYASELHAKCDHMQVWATGHFLGPIRTGKRDQLTRPCRERSRC
ncbi:hypothetical protein JRQ81_012852, partial [Phrynocephalus forsythii]